MFFIEIQYCEKHVIANASHRQLSPFSNKRAHLLALNSVIDKQRNCVHMFSNTLCFRVKKRPIEPTKASSPTTMLLS